MFKETVTYNTWNTTNSWLTAHSSRQFGRMYDPYTSMFLSPDNYIQAPDNSQSFNRYAYCLYNPLKYIDPSGYVVRGRNDVLNPYFLYYDFSSFSSDGSSFNTDLSAGKQLPVDDWYEDSDGNIQWTDYKSQAEMDVAGTDGKYLGEAVVLVHGSYDEKLGENGTLTGKGAKPAQITVPITGGWSLAGNNISSSSGSILGTKNEYPIYIKTNNVNRMIIDTLGNVGIGTEQPRHMLHVVGGNIMISRQSAKAPGSTNGSLYFGSDVSSSTPNGNWGIEYLDQDGIYGLNFWQPYSVGSNTRNYVLFLSDNGNIGVGTSNPQAKFAVNGDILAKSIRVSTSSTYWPDYVFSPDYELMSLEELENYITNNKHLPGIISAREVEEYGNVDLGEMNTKLLKKIEELTLYIINLQKQIDELKK